MITTIGDHDYYNNYQRDDFYGDYYYRRRRRLPLPTDWFTDLFAYLPLPYIVYLTLHTRLRPTTGYLLQLTTRYLVPSTWYLRLRPLRRRRRRLLLLRLLLLLVLLLRRRRLLLLLLLLPVRRPPAASNKYCEDATSGNRQHGGLCWCRNTEEIGGRLYDIPSRSWLRIAVRPRRQPKALAWDLRR